MSKMYKKNMGLILVLAGVGVVAVGLLVYVVIVLLQWSELRDRTGIARDKVQQLVKSTPAPGAENERRIQQDIALYEQKNIGLVDNFKSPLRPAVDEFLKALPPANADMLTEEEIELYKVEGTGVEAEEDKPAVPLKIRKFTYDEFRTFFPARFDKYCEENNKVEDKDRFSLDTLHGFSESSTKLFPQGKWNAALEKFVEAAQGLTFEVIDDSNRLPILLAAFGLPRRVDGKLSKLKEQVDNIIEIKIKPIAADRPEFFAAGALDFIGGGNGRSADGNSSRDSSSAYSWQVADYPAVFFHWDVFGDIVKRLYRNKVATLKKVVLRTRKEEGESSGGSSSNINLLESFESDGNYKIYHYTLVFTCEMNVLRKVMTDFDNAWKGDEKNGFGKRMYIVRGVALYASENGAGRVMNPEIVSGSGEQQSSVPQTRVVRRRARRRQMEEQQSETSADKVEFKPLYAVAPEVARERYYNVHRRLHEEKLPKEEEMPRFENGQFVQSESSKEMNAEDKQKFYDDYERKLPLNERYGYATVLVGEHNDECEVYLDVDYVVLEQNQ
ncbi:MAG: hypothetical protein E7057_04190 [Lentisphaerae bacterium]|nr:hypothetical protein [Lentisphaerota bacterium]